MVSPYDVLMIDEDAGESEIEEAYRERVKQAHPDKGGSKEEFQLVKSAYQEIQSDTSNRNRNANTHNRRGSEELRCSKCNSVIHDVSQATYRQETDEVFCPDCVVDTYCRVCGKDLLLTVDQFSDLDGEPVCMSCLDEQNQRQHQNQQHTTQNQITTTEKILNLSSSIAKFILASSALVFIGFYVSIVLTGGTEQANFAMRQLFEYIRPIISGLAWLFIILVILAFRD